MAFLQFPKQQYFKIADDSISNITRCGYFNLDDGTELYHIMATILQRGTIATPYQVRINIYGNDTFTAPIFSSDWATLSATTLLADDGESAYVNNWLGNIYFDFDGNPLNANQDYYMAVETSGYTRISDTFYLGINLDWYSPVNTQLTANKAGARIRILGKR